MIHHTVLNYSEKQKLQMNKAIEYFLPKYPEYDRAFFLRYFKKFHKNGIDTYFIPRINRLLKLPKHGTQLKRLILLYGKEEGKRRFEEFAKKRVYINSFEYKNKYRGWTREQYDEYNKNRAPSLENMLKRYGKRNGKKKWEEFCKKEQYAGVSLQFFKDKYGEEEGQLKYLEVNKKKRLIPDNFIRKWGEEEGLKRYKKFYDKKIFSSNMADDLFDKIYNKLPKELQEHTHYNRLNKEFGKYDPIHQKYYMYDFTISNIGFCIEFNGDYWHANPSIYKPNEIIRLKGGDKLVSEIWEKDKNKKDLIESFGYKVYYVWESDYNDNPDEIERKLLNEIRIIPKLGN